MDEPRYELFADKHRKRRPPAKVTEASLLRAGQRYIERYGGPSHAVATVLRRRARKAATRPDTELEDAMQLVDTVMATLLNSSALDDRHWAAERARRLHARGTPMRMIRMRLAQKRLDRDHIDAAIEALGEEAGDPDLAAAWAYARRRRFGPFRFDGRSERRDKDLAAMARAGFHYGIASKVIDAESADDDLS